MKKEMIIQEDLTELIRDPADKERFMEGCVFDHKKLAASSNLTPLGDNVLIRRRRYSTTTSSGLLRSASDEHKDLCASQGTIEAVGPDVLNVVPGDEVMHKKFEGRDVKGQDGFPYYLISESQLFGIVGCDRQLKSKSEFRIKEARSARA